MDKLPIPHPARESYGKHRRDVTRQIILPVILITVVVVGLAALAIFAATGSNTAVSLWADISLIWIIIPMMLLMLVILALTAALAYGLMRLLKVSPHYTGLAQHYALWLNAEIVAWADKIVQPVLTIKSWLEIFVKSEEKNESKTRNPNQ
jgi:hypothetical protein